MEVYNLFTTTNGLLPIAKDLFLCLYFFKVVSTIYANPKGCRYLMDALSLIRSSINFVNISRLCLIILYD